MSQTNEAANDASALCFRDVIAAADLARAMGDRKRFIKLVDLLYDGFDFGEHHRPASQPIDQPHWLMPSRRREDIELMNHRL